MKKFVLFALFGLLLMPSAPTRAREANEVDDRRGATEIKFGDQEGIAKSRGGIGLGIGRMERIRIGGDEEKGLSKKEVIERRFTWALSSLNNLYTRLGDIITRLKAGQIDMTKAETDLAAAKIKIDAATAVVTELKTFVATVKSASVAPNGKTLPVISAADKAKIKDLAKKAKESIQEAHKALRVVHVDIAQSLGVSDGENVDDSGNDTNDDN